MSKVLQILLRWLPAFLLMLVIFAASAQPSSDLPDFDWADRIVKKGGHVTGYALLAVAYWHALRFRRGNQWLAWGLAVLYAVTDEIHQSFVPGRHPSIWDVLIFDNLGAFLSLWFLDRYKRQRPDSSSLIAEGHSAKG